MITTTTLKNAAFAIEHDLFTDPDGCNYLVKDGAILRRWEPLADDGDAFRIVMALDMTVNCNRDGLTVIVQTWRPKLHKAVRSNHNDADVRSAIVEVAAMVGAAL